MVFKKNKHNIGNLIKDKVENLVDEFINLNLDKVKREIENFVEVNITSKIEHYIKKIMSKIFFVLLIFFGAVFIFHSFNSIVLSYFNVPQIYHNLVFGIVLCLVGFLIKNKFK